MQNDLPRLVGAGPLIAAICDTIGLPQIVDERVAWDPVRCKLSPGERIKALVVNILTQHKPLYRIGEAFERSDPELLLGEGVLLEDLNDDCLGRALDKLQAADARLIFSLIASRALVTAGVDTRFLHWDSTSRSLYGEYPSSETCKVQPKHGHSKDHRPDLKQILLTLLCSREGFPLLGEVHSGNASDKQLNREVIDELCRQFSPEQLLELVYVADSALVTVPNLRAMAEVNLRFLSRLPETFAAAAEAKAAAWASGSWQPIGAIGERRGAAQYAASEQSALIDGRRYRLVVYRSDHLEARKAKALEKEVAEEGERLRAEAEELGRRRFACAADGEAALEAWQRQHAEAWHEVAGSVVAEQERQKREHPGRPRKGEEPVWRTVYRVQATVGEVDVGRLAAERQRRSTFVLITNLAVEEFSVERLLVEYKQQTSIEQKFHFLKDPLFVDAFFLHKAERVEALGYVLLMACLVFAILERRVRAEGRPLYTPSRGQLKNPTGYEILNHLQGAIVIRVGPGQRELYVQPSFRRTFTEILARSGFDERVYTCVPARKTG